VTTNDEIMEAEVRHDLAALRRELKKLSKNQLVRQIFLQMRAAVEQQNINKVLMEKLKEAGIEDEDSDKSNT